MIPAEVSRILAAKGGKSSFNLAGVSDAVSPPADGILKKGADVNKNKVYLIVQSVLCVVVCAMLAAAAVMIYRAGLAQKAADPLSWIYTREKVAAALAPVMPVLILEIILTVVGLIMKITDANADKPAKDTEWQRDTVISRVATPSSEMKAERSRQRKLNYGGWAAFALCMVPILIYITNGNHFPNGDLEPMFLALIAHTLPWTLIGLGILMISTVLQEKSMEREIVAAREQIKLEKAGGVKPETDGGKRQTADRARLLRIALLAVAVMMIVAGTFNGSARDVFGKAVKICTECIGLG